MSFGIHAGRRAAAGSLIALVALAACSESTTSTAPIVAPDSPALSQSDNNGNSDNSEHGHVMMTRGQLENLNAAGSKAGGGSGIFYHGGPVLQAATNVAAVYWAASPIYNGGPAAGTNGSGAGDGSLVGSFLRSIGGSPYYGINSSYTDGSGRAINNVVNYTQFYANNVSVPSAGASVSDAQMIAALQNAFNAGKLTYDASTLYAIFTAGTVNLGGGFGSQYCAYHTHGTVTIGGVAKTVLYAAMPYNNAYPSSCTSGLAPANGTLDPGADYEVNTLVHEIEETTTDMMGNAWYDRRGYENADKCAWTWGTVQTASNGGKYNISVGGKNYLVQQNWKNTGSGGCGLSL
ncbi:MAG: hypothetical protein ABIY52_14470 [Gemmatimonadaceae bacterium]